MNRRSISAKPPSELPPQPASAGWAEIARCFSAERLASTESMVRVVRVRRLAECVAKTHLAQVDQPVAGADRR